MQIKLLEQLVVRLGQCTSTNALEKCWDSYLASLNITMYSISYYHYHPKARHKLYYEFCSKAFLPWHQHYVNEGYNDVDDLLDTVFQTGLPNRWDIKEQIKQASTERERKMRLDSFRFGAQSGLSIPVHGPQNEFINFLFVQMQGQHCLENWCELRFYLFSASHYYYHYIRDLLVKEVNLEKHSLLSVREIQCLTLVHRGLSVEKIADQLRITVRTVNFHLQNINKKLGTQNKYASVAKAIELNLLTKL